MATKVKAFGYVRVSGKGQVDGDGFTRQEEAIRSFAQAHGYRIEHVYQEGGVSGTTSEEDRPAFMGMVSAILKDGVRTVIIEGMDRLARELRIQEHLVIYLASKGITLMSARTGENVTEAIMADPMRKALVQIQGVFAELERGMLVKKLRQARERVKARDGKCEGRKSTREVAPEVVALVRSLRRKRMSYRAIADHLNAQGIRTMTGKDWTPSNVQTMYDRSKAGGHRSWVRSGSGE